MSDRIEAEILDVLGEEVAAAVDTPLVVIEGPKGDPGAPGKDGHSPVVTATKSGKTTTISVDGAAIATVEDGKDGTDGQNGAPGVYYGTTQPTGETHPVWIDPDGEHDDGGLLPAVTAADNGKVLRVVNSSWSAADMPTGGTDIGITGATVGQIAKIAAVDASGVPTAWAPVDMPSGMSEWQLITDTTIAEEDASVTLFVSQKDSGESFLCHELLIAWIGIAVTDGTESGKAWISLNPDEAGYNSGECGLMTSAYFYYTSHANYMRTMHVKSLPYKVEYVDISVSTNDSIDAQVIWQNGISSVEVSAYGRKSFYGRVIIYGR